MRLKKGVLTIPKDHKKNWSWQNWFVTFIASFGTVWLFHEPLATLGFGIGISSWGVTGYIYLLVLSIIASICIHRVDQVKWLNRTKFIHLDVILEEAGMRIPVYVSQDLRVERFISLFLEEMSQDSNMNDSIKFAPVFENVLIAKLHKSERKLPNTKTIKEAGLRDGDECKILRTSVKPDIMNRVGVYHMPWQRR